MATLSITIPDPVAGRVADAFATQYGYAATLSDGTPNPQTKAQFMKAEVISFMKDVVAGAEGRAAGDAARLSAIAAANSQITLT